MPTIQTTSTVINGKEAIIVHDKLCADGPVDSLTNKPLIDPNTGNPYLGKNDDMAEKLFHYTPIIRGLNNGQNKKFGILSLIASMTPIFIYDHPAFQEINDKGFTDGKHVFINADYMRKVIKEEPFETHPEGGLTLFILQKLMEKIELTLTKSELSFFEEKLLKKVNVKPLLTTEQNEKNVHINTITIEKVIETLEANGLQYVIKSLELPNRNNLDEIEQLKNTVHKNTIDEIEKKYKVSFEPVNTGHITDINPMSSDTTNKKIQQMKNSVHTTTNTIKENKPK